LATLGHPGDLISSAMVRGRRPGLCENRGMKRARKWSADNKAGERHVDEASGPLRRRKALRHLDSLALDPERELNPSAATAHVRVLGESDGVSGGPRPVPRGTAGKDSQGEAVPDSDSDSASAGRLHGHRVLAVPIDQSFDDPSRSVTTEN
jgi:hypothetical protein